MDARVKAPVFIPKCPQMPFLQPFAAGLRNGVSEPRLAGDLVAGPDASDLEISPVW